MKLNKRHIFTSDKGEIKDCRNIKKIYDFILSLPSKELELSEKFCKDKFFSIILCPRINCIEFILNVLREKGTYYVQVYLDFYNGTVKVCFGDAFLRMIELSDNEIEEVKLTEEEIFEFEELYLPEVDSLLNMILNIDGNDINQIVFSNINLN